MKLLGIDYGNAKIGLAIGDIESGVSTPIGVIKNLGWNNVVDEINKLCEKERIEKIVIGVPVNPGDMESEQIKNIQQFIKLLSEKTGLEVMEEDERFSTKEAQKLIEKGKSKDDDLSAMIILQSYLDKA